MLFIYNILFIIGFIFFIPGMIWKLIFRGGRKRNFLERFGIFTKSKKLFWSILIISLIIGCIYYVSQPKQYSVSTTLNVVRLISKDSSSQKKYENDFSSFYRLQADGKIADSVVAWLKSPSIVSDILKDSGIKEIKYNNKNLASIYKANKMSSQIVDVRFMVTNKEQGKKQTEAIKNKINNLLKTMNPENSTDSWFEVSIEKPVVYFYEKSLTFVLSLSLAIGFFVSFIVIITKHYLKEDK